MVGFVGVVGANVFDFPNGRDYMSIYCSLSFLCKGRQRKSSGHFENGAAWLSLEVVQGKKGGGMEGMRISMRVYRLSRV